MRMSFLKKSARLTALLVAVAFAAGVSSAYAAPQPQKDQKPAAQQPAPGKQEEKKPAPEPAKPTPQQPAPKK